VKVFITGGAGFIGSHLAERLLGHGVGVVILDDLSTGAMDNLQHLYGSPGLEYRIGSVTDAPLVAELVDRCDVTVHLAAAVGVRLIVERPVHTIETNVHGTEVVLNAVAKKQKRVVLASTSEVYGKSDKIPFSESAVSNWYSRWVKDGFSALERWAEPCSADGKHLFGDSVSLADLCLVPQMYNARRFGVELHDYPRLVAIDEHLCSLPAFAAAAPEVQPDAE
jgi:NAD dependent epimerase/dehydratase family enzyme